MTDQAKKPAAPKSAIEIAGTLAGYGRLQEALKNAGQIDLQANLPLSMQLKDLVAKGEILPRLYDTLRPNQSARDTLTEALKSTNVADQLRKIGMAQAGTMQVPEPKRGSSNSTGLAIQSASDIGTAVRFARKAKGMSQQNFADLAGVGRRFLSELESGKPTLEIGKVLKAAAAAGFHLKMVAVGQADE